MPASCRSRAQRPVRRDLDAGCSSPLGFTGANRLENGGIHQRGGVAEFAALGHITQQSAHDLAASGFRKLRHDVNLAGFGDR